MNTGNELEQAEVVAVSRKPWEAPRVVLERSLVVTAQGGMPPAGGPPSGIVGPLGVSGGYCGTPN